MNSRRFLSRFRQVWFGFIVTLSLPFMPSALLAGDLSGELVFNGDFELGNTGFHTDYGYADVSVTPGTFAIQPDPAFFNGGFESFSDHTTGSGLLFVADGGGSASAAVWSQTVTIQPHKFYRFEAWAASPYSINPALLQFSVNGSPIGTHLVAVEEMGVWRKFSAIWNSGGATTVTLKISDLNSDIINYYGNDFVIDDISFKAQPTSGNDFIWQHADSRLATSSIGSGNLIDFTSLNGKPSEGWQIVGLSDLNKDKHDDFIWQHRDGRIAVWLMNGLQRTSSRPLGNGGAGWHVVAVADFNRDEQADFLWRHDDGRMIVWFMNGTTFVSSRILNGGEPVNPVWRIAGTADFDGDGKMDMIWEHTDGWLVVSLLDGTNFRRSFYINGGVAIGAGWHLVGLSDDNEDGWKDLVWRHEDGRMAVWTMNGVKRTRSFLLPRGVPVSSGWNVVGVK